MAKRQSQPQVSLLSFLSAPKKARRTEPNHQGELDSEDELDPVPVIASEQDDTPFESDAISLSEGQNTTPEDVGCSSQCCTSEEKAFQPNGNIILKTLSMKQRNFQSSWYKQFPWLSVCTSRKKVFCFYCRYAARHKLLTFSKSADNVFSENGFQNWKKAIEKFKSHEGSLSHTEAKMKWIAQGRPTIGSQLSAQLKDQQQMRRAGLLKQMKGIQFLTRQGIALLGHKESEGNLKQLMLMWSHEDEVVKTWVKENRYTCYQTVNELLSIMGQNLLRNIVKKTKEGSPAWFSVIADEATDVCHTEQLNLSIRWVNDQYEVLEDPIGLFRVPDTKAETLFTVIKDLLIRCSLSLDLCRGQAYDGAANMQGK